MTTPHDTIHEAIRVVAAGFGDPDDTRPASEVSVEAAMTLGDGTLADWRGWQALAIGLANLSSILLVDRERESDQAPIDVLADVGGRYPRTD